MAEAKRKAEEAERELAEARRVIQAERDRIAAEEQKRLEEEAEKRRLEAAEVERKRLAEDAERKRIEAEQAERKKAEWLEQTRGDQVILKQMSDRIWSGVNSAFSMEVTSEYAHGLCKTVFEKIAEQLRQLNTFGGLISESV